VEELEEIEKNLRKAIKEKNYDKIIDILLSRQGHVSDDWLIQVMMRHPTAVEEYVHRNMELGKVKLMAEEEFLGEELSRKDLLTEGVRTLRKRLSQMKKSNTYAGGTNYGD